MKKVLVMALIASGLLAGSSDARDVGLYKISGGTQVLHGGPFAVVHPGTAYMTYDQPAPLANTAFGIWYWTDGANKLMSPIFAINCQPSIGVSTLKRCVFQNTLIKTGAGGAGVSAARVNSQLNGVGLGLPAFPATFSGVNSLIHATLAPAALTGLSIGFMNAAKYDTIISADPAVTAVSAILQIQAELQLAGYQMVIGAANSYASAGAPIASWPAP